MRSHGELAKNLLDTKNFVAPRRTIRKRVLIKCTEHMYALCMYVCMYDVHMYARIYVDMNFSANDVLDVLKNHNITSRLK